MRFIQLKCVFLLFAAIPVFSQNSQEQLSLEPYWRQALGGEVLSLPSYQAQSAVVALDGGNIRAYSTSGTPMWSFFSGGRISPYITRSREGTSYFARTNGTLFAINRAGRELWRRSLGGPLSAKVITGWDSRLFVPVNGKIYCYTASGNLLWTKSAESQFSVAPKLDREGGIIYALDNNEVFRLDHFGNANVWKLNNTPAVLLSMESADSGNTTAGTLKQKIIVIYTDGSMEILGYDEDWFLSEKIDVHSAVLPRLPSAPLAAACMGNNIAVTMSDGRVALISLDEKRVIWTGDTHIRELMNNRVSIESDAEMIFDERGIYIMSKNGATGFIHDGRRLWFMSLQNTAAIPAFGNDGVLYSGGKDWILYAYKIEDRILPERNDIYGPVPEGTYGMGRPRIINKFDIPLTEQETRARLNQISIGINTGRIGDNEPEWTSFLLTISAGQHPLQIRLEAMNLIGMIGSHETIPWLINIFTNDREPVIKAAAANAIGCIGVDPKGIAIQAFFFSIINSSIRDDQVLTAIATATGALCRFSGPPLSETGIKILLMISERHQPSVARRQAERELATLR
ncbi:MAG: PQQ-binding-like beta-propeller repeat protein [Treponema sp.]|nr:PQQ-binding-like beta-propeller repeat protein [Treponema sp.]